MNAILGARIKSLRESKGFTQEQIAEKMACTRQKYARLEKGFVDISYSSIKTIASILGVNVEEITSSVNSIPEEQLKFRSQTDPAQEDSFTFLLNMIDTFYAHRKLYHSVRLADIDE